MFNKKIKITLKKSIAVLMTVTMISIGMIPINSVYANMSVTISGNNSTSESGSNRLMTHQKILEICGQRECVVIYTTGQEMKVQEINS